MLESVIMAVTNDIYELPIRQFDSTKEMAKALNITTYHARRMISRQTVYSKLNCKFIRVYLEDENEIEKD